MNTTSRAARKHAGTRRIAVDRAEQVDLDVGAVVGRRLVDQPGAVLAGGD
jgi:hypothetical protein